MARTDALRAAAPLADADRQVGLGLAARRPLDL
jgi:hypothetical protein